MNLVVGVGLMAATLAVYFWAFEQHRRPVPARWTRSNGLSTAICLVIVSLLAAALCFVAASLMSPLAMLASMGTVMWAALAAEVAAIVLIGPRLLTGARNAVRPMATVTPMPPRGPAGTPPVNTNAGVVKRRKAA